MRTLFLLAFCLVRFVNSVSVELPECDRDSVLAFSKCLPMLDELNQEHSNKTYVVDNMTELCDRVQACFAPLNCKETAKLKHMLDNTCSYIHYMTEENKKCIVSFFKDAYLAQYSNKSTCLKDHGFMEGPSHKKDAYHQGKSCFLDHVQKSCTPKAQNFFTKNYEKFVSHVSVKPEGTDCKAPYYTLQTLSCDSIGSESTKLKNGLLMSKLNPNDPRGPIAIKMCHDTQKCLSESCTVTDSANIAYAKVFSCEMLEMSLSEWIACYFGIMQDKPDLSKYKCLGETDFFEQSEAAVCEKFVSQKDCTKEIMQGICGARAVEKFDSFSKTITKQVKCVKL